MEQMYAQKWIFVGFGIGFDFSCVTRHIQYPKKKREQDPSGTISNVECYVFFVFQEING